MLPWTPPNLIQNTMFNIDNYWYNSWTLYKIGELGSKYLTILIKQKSYIWGKVKNLMP